MAPEEAGTMKGSGDGVDTWRYPYLASLNSAQLQAVTAPPSAPLQILAGPGSGKTRVLTSRVAYLVQHHAYRPYEITAVTFTNKASNEMRKRLEILLGVKVANDLVLGTFHATCAKYLRRYGQLISLPNSFSITDSEDSKKLMSGLIKAKAEMLSAARMSLKDSAVLSEISKAKARGESPEGMAIRAANDPSSSTSTLSFVAELYAEYEAALREANSLDFDDLLVFGLNLFRSFPDVLKTCKHILVDEFQDTNTTQYELMRCFAKADGGVSVVGDPDQSIYGWRSAEVENLNRMTSDFPGVEAIYLEHNYRSTGSILSAAHSVVSQDRERIPKNLYTSHPTSTPVTLKTFSTPVIEASFIATEIKRLIAYSGGVLNYGDFAILLRYNALSRVIESSLQKDSIPNRIIGGHKFFERMEIKDILAYLQLAENPGFTPAFLRVVNVPRRAIGDKSVADLVAAAKTEKISSMELCERIIDGDKLPTGIKPAVKRNLASFVGTVRKLRRAADKGSSVADLIRMTIEKTNYEEYLRTSQQDFDSRWENVQELISYSLTVAEDQLRELNDPPEEGFLAASSAAVEAMVNLATTKEEGEDKRIHPMFRRISSTSTSHSRSISAVAKEKPRKKPKMNGNGESLKIKEAVVEVLSSDEDASKSSKRPRVVKQEIGEVDKGGDLDEGDIDVDERVSMKPLSYFLQTSMLSTDTDADKNDLSSNLKVTTTTVHAAKGLEWPVVFIPAVEQGIYPSYRCTEPHEIAEERRLLYVAMTRAQAFLTMSHCQFRMMGLEDSNKSLSEFVHLSKKKVPETFNSDLPEVDVTVRRNLASMIKRQVPDEEETKELIRKHVCAAPPLSMWDAPEPRDKMFNRFARRDVTKATRAAEYWASEGDDYALPDTANGGSSSNGFTSARSTVPSRLSKPYSVGKTADRSPPNPVVKLRQKNYNLPGPLPFTFGASDGPKAQADLGMFTNSSNSSLAAMKSLGLPDDDSPNRNPSPSPPSISSFQAGATTAMANWRSLAMPDSAGAPAGAVPLAKGTKRLGMGRPAPWGATKKP